MNTQQAKDISITDYLNYLGYEPKKIRGNDSWYLSPFRKEKTASFKVNNQKNLFYDFGVDIGGTIIDFGIKYYGCSVSELLGKLEGVFSFPEQENDLKYSQQENELTNSNAASIHTIKDIGNNRAISDYIRFRKIDLNIAKEFAKEVYYIVGKKHFFGVGFKNDADGYEVRNKYFKGCVGRKDISHFRNGNKDLRVFEGFFDFLSWAQNHYSSLKKMDIVVLNSLSLLGRLRQTLNNYEEVHFYFDNDKAGINAGILLQEIKPTAIDHRMEYLFFKDLNEQSTVTNGEEFNWIL